MKYQPKQAGKMMGQGIFAIFMSYFLGSHVNMFPHVMVRKPEKKYRASNSNPHQGKREKARRRAQMAKGMHQECRAVK